MATFKDLTYQTFGRLFVICPTESKKGHWYWWCHCNCGNFVEVAGDSLHAGDTRSCGCLQREEQGNRQRQHGESYTKLYGIWKSMRSRCQNPNAQRYSRYGGRGIKVDISWESYSTFKDWAVSQGYKEGLSIDRIDSNKDYCPENCRWTTRVENTKRRWHERNIS